MNRRASCAAVSILALGATIGSADAKKVYYEINGQRYSYSTNNQQQVQEARGRIEAADAARAAKAKAEAERAANPLSAVFGSQAQREAAEAQSRLDRLLAEQEPRPAKAAERSRRREAKPARSEPRLAETEPKAARSKPKREPARVAAPSEKPDPTIVAAPIEAKPSGKPGIKSVSFDLASGIKTTEMTDGSVHEEAFDSSALPKLGADGRAPDSLTGFVEQVRKPQRGDATGSIGKAEAQTPAAK